MAAKSSLVHLRFVGGELDGQELDVKRARLESRVRITTTLSGKTKIGSDKFVCFEVAATGEWKSVPLNGSEPKFSVIAEKPAEAPKHEDTPEEKKPEAKAPKADDKPKAEAKSPNGTAKDAEKAAA